MFVPSIPTPLAGAVYILTSERVHPLDVPFAQAIKAISRWGSGSKDLVAAMQGGENALALKGTDNIEEASWGRPTKQPRRGHAK